MENKKDIKHLCSLYVMNLIKFDIISYQNEIKELLSQIAEDTIDSLETVQTIKHLQNNNNLSIEALHDCLSLLHIQIPQTDTKEIILNEVVEKVITELNSKCQNANIYNEIKFELPKYNIFIKTYEFLVETIVKKMYDLAKAEFDKKIITFSIFLNSNFASIILKYKDVNSNMIDFINEPFSKKEIYQQKLSKFNNSFSFLKLLEHMKIGVLSFAHENNCNLIHFTLNTPIKYSNINQKNKTQNMYNWENKTILIVDDIEVNYMFLQTILAETKAKTIYAENGAIAVSECKIRNDIDVVLMDLKMPVMDGYEATSIIKDANPSLPVIIQTAYSFNEEHEKCIKMGCNDFITKPLKSENVLSVLAKYLK